MLQIGPSAVDSLSPNTTHYITHTPPIHSPQRVFPYLSSLRHFLLVFIQACMHILSHGTASPVNICATFSFSNFVRSTYSPYIPIAKHYYYNYTHRCAFNRKEDAVHWKAVLYWSKQRNYGKTRDIELRKMANSEAASFSFLYGTSENKDLHNAPLSACAYVRSSID